jgi:molybdopterin converting factor small subunit
MPTVWVPAPWRDKLTGGASQVEVAGDTVRQVIEALEAEYPGFRQRLIDTDEDRIRADIAVSVDGEISAEGLRRKVTPTSEVNFLPAMAGGASR